MIDDLDLDLEELESRLYSQVHHTTVEDIENETTLVNANEAGNNMRRQSMRYFQTTPLSREDRNNSSNEGYIRLENSNTPNRDEHNAKEGSDKPANNPPHVVHSKRRAADFFNVPPSNMRQISDVQMNQAIPQIVHMLNPCNNILLVNQIPTQVISHNYIPASQQINSNQDRYLMREARREASRLRRIASRKKKKQMKKKLMMENMQSDSKSDFYKNKNMKKGDFKIHRLTEKVALTKPNQDKEKVLTISDSDSDGCFEVVEERELIVLSSDDSDLDVQSEPEKESEKIKKPPDETIKQEIKVEKGANTTVKTTNTKGTITADEDDDILLIDDIPKDLEVIEIDCDANSVTNAESNKNSSEKSMETNSTSSDLKGTPKKNISLSRLREKIASNQKERNDLLRTPDSTSNDFLDNIELRQQKFNFALHGSDFGEDDHNFIKPKDINSETESSCSTSECTPVKNTFFNEIEFDTPNKELFSEQNLEMFGNYITPNRKEKTSENTSTKSGDFVEVLTKASKRIRPKSPSEAGNSDSSSECDYNVQTSSKMRKILPDLTSINAPSTSKKEEELDKKQIANVNKRKFDNELTTTKKKDKENSDTLEINNDDSILLISDDKEPKTDLIEAMELKNDAPQYNKEDIVFIDDDAMSLASLNNSVIIETSDLQLGNLETPEKRKPKKKSKSSGGFSSFWTSNMDKFYNSSWGLENFSVEEMQKKMSDNSDLWKIRDEDRGYLQTYMNRVRCNKCNERGHIAARCPNPQRPVVCTLCGETGHYEPRCPNGMCTSCGSLGGYTTYCSGCAKWNRLQCRICSVYGHIDIKCPDLWRRYHLTTEPGPIVKPLRGNFKKIDDRWCPGCARNRHFDYRCRTNPQKPSDPHIIDYTDVYNFPKSQPFLIHCDLTKSPSSTVTNTTRKTEETVPSNYDEQSPSSSTNNEKSTTINTMNFKGSDYKGRFDNIYPPLDMIPEYFREQFMYIEKAKDTCDNKEVEINDNFRCDEINTSFDDVSNKRDQSVHKLDETLYAYVNSVKGISFLEETRKEWNISYLIENKKALPIQGTLTIYGKSFDVKEVSKKLINFFNLMPSFDNMPKYSKPAYNFLTSNLDKIEKLAPNYKSTYTTLLKLEDCLRSGEHIIMTKKKIKDVRKQLNMLLFGKLQLGDGHKHMTFLNELCQKYKNGENYKIPLNELFDFVDSYSYIFLDTINHNYESYMGVQSKTKQITERNMSNVYKLMKLVGINCQQRRKYEELKQLNRLKSDVERTSSVRAYIEFKSFCQRLLKHFRIDENIPL